MYGFKECLDVGSYCFFDTGTAEIRGISASSDTPHTFASCKTSTATRWDLHNVVLMSAQCVRRARGVPAARRSAWRSTPCARTDIHIKLHQERAWSVIDQSPRVLLLWGREFEHPEVSYCHVCACFQNKSHQAPPNDHVFKHVFLRSFTPHSVFLASPQFGHIWLLEEWPAPVTALSCPNIIYTRLCIVFNCILLWWNKVQF